MEHYVITIAYDGSDFNGWQRLKTRTDTVQAVLEEAVSKYFKEIIKITGSGRTDAGVHAVSQTADFYCNNKSKLLPCTDDINKLLPSTIRITSLKSASSDFHSRKSAVSKTYAYCISLNKKCDVFTSKYVCNPTAAPVMYGCPDDYIHLNVKAMEQAAKILTGTYDFSAFTTDKTTGKSHIRTINYIKLSTLRQPSGKDILVIKYNGNGFLYNMVRIISGTLLLVGLNKISPDSVDGILQSRLRRNAGPTLPANALFLCEVQY